MLVGGNGGGKPRLAEKLAEDLATDDALALVDKAIAFFRENAKPHERIGRMIERIGMDAFRDAVLA